MGKVLEPAKWAGACYRDAEHAADKIGMCIWILGPCLRAYLFGWALENSTTGGQAFMRGSWRTTASWPRTPYTDDVMKTPSLRQPGRD